jgi:hypothetical protein
MDDNVPKFFALSHKLGLIIGKKVEKGIADGLNKRSFARSIWSTDSGRTAPKIYNEVTIALDVL